MKSFFLSAISVCILLACSNQPAKSTNKPIHALLDSFIKAQNADIAVSIAGPNETDTYNNKADDHQIMMSVVKFPQAVALLNLVDQGKLSLDSIILFDSLSLKRKTWSPLAEEHPYGDIKMTLRECFDYSVGMSDNIVCDRLYELLSPEDVTKYIGSLGIKDFGIACNYKNLDINHLEVNYTSAKAMTSLLKMISDKKILSEGSRQVLLDIMTKTETGPMRLKGLLPKDIVVAHKTGTFYENDSFVNAMNDVGIVYMPDGKSYCISILVNNSFLGGDGTEKVMAYINKLYFDYASKP